MPSQAFAPRGTQFQRGTNPLAPTGYVTLSEVIKITRSGSKANLANTTNMDSGVFEEVLPTTLASGEVTVEFNLVPGSATQATLLNDFNNQTLSPYKIELPGGTLGNWTFNAYVVSDDFDLEVTKQGTKTVKLAVTGGFTFTPGA